MSTNFYRFSFKTFINKSQKEHLPSNLNTRHSGDRVPSSLHLYLFFLNNHLQTFKVWAVCLFHKSSSNPKMCRNLLKAWIREPRRCKSIIVYFGRIDVVKLWELSERKASLLPLSPSLTQSLSPAQTRPPLPTVPRSSPAPMLSRILNVISTKPNILAAVT